MTILAGIAVELTTSNESQSGTDDHLYVGIVGKGGGREFALATPSEDFESGTELFLLGDIWDSTVTSVPSAKKPFDSEPGGENDPVRALIEAELVDYVYLRKQGDNTEEDDDVYRLRRVTVSLFFSIDVTGAGRRVDYEFIAPAQKPWLTLANENGHTVYLHEVADPLGESIAPV
ncbi:hypothetical protein [Modestobacter marinus]|uniref:hypothetical protein n=1 Tax=Modestobacter marinus TaxID=477641 RepID=UPI001C943A98|nr:hypothetical protein [Modestobacter marinus]